MAAEGDAADGDIPEENEDVLTKLIRVIANLCINPEIGTAISQSERLGVLIALLRRRRVGCSEDLVLHIVGAINNISYYRSPDNVVLRQQLEVAELVAPLLSHGSLEVVIETARVFGNLSQVGGAAT